MSAPPEPLSHLFAGLAAGLGGGALSGLFGVGGGIVLVPLLSGLLGLNQHQAQGVTLAALLFPNTFPAVLHFRRRGIPIHWGLATAMITGFLPGVWAGAKVATGIPEGPLRIGFVVFLLLLAIRTFILKPGNGESSVQVRPRWLPGLLIGTIGGICSGLLGIGGGIVMIPLLVMWTKLPQHEAQLTSIVMMLPPVGLPGILVYAKAQSFFPWMVMIGLALGFQVGALGGARMATGMAGPRLQRIFAVVMVGMAGLLLMR